MILPSEIQDTALPIRLIRLSGKDHLCPHCTSLERKGKPKNILYERPVTLFGGKRGHSKNQSYCASLPTAYIGLE